MSKNGTQVWSSKPTIEYSRHQVSCNSTSGNTRWTITANKDGYYPIGYEVYHSHASQWKVGAENVTPQLGTITADGYYETTGGTDRTVYLRVTWMKA